MHVGPGISDTEGGHSDDFADAVGFHGGNGVGVRVGHHAWGGGVGGPRVVADTDGVEGHNYCGGKIVRGCGDCFFDV